jgi:cell division protein FtsI (penicillin-binding protein 3)
MPMDRKSELLVRVYIVFFLFVVLALIILGKVITISLFEGEKWKKLGGLNVKWIEMEGERGNIYDESGNLLATSLPYFDIYVDVMTISEPLFRTELNSLCHQMSQMFGKDAAYWKSKFQNARAEQNRYLLLAKNLTRDQLDTVRSFAIFKEGRYRGGLLYEQKKLREKPYKLLASRTIGIDRDNATKVGLEKYYDKVLEGEKIKRLMHRYPGNQWLPIYDLVNAYQDRGADIVTTLNMAYQDIVNEQLMEAVVKYKAEAGTAILMEVKSGAVKAMSNLTQVKGREGEYSEDYNYAVARLSEPGSTFKLASAMAVLKSGNIDLDTRVALHGGKKQFFDRTMYDSDLHGKEVVSFKEAFEMSSNVGMANAAFSVYGKSREDWQSFYDALESMGVMTVTGIEIPGEQPPFFKHPAKLKVDNSKRWSGTTVPWMAHGYELEMTPLQILNFYNAVANGGRMMKPYLVKEILEPGKKEKKVHPQIINENIADKVIVDKAQELLQGVAERGTAKRFEITNTTFAGKTGTTRINYWKATGDKEYNASFVGYFPAEDPEYSLIVVIYNPKGAYYGSQVAGPVFSEIVQRIASMKEVSLPEPELGRKVVKAHSGYKSDYKSLLEFIGLDYRNHARSNWVDMSEDETSLAFKAKKIKTKTVPDLNGMGLRDAIYILESLGYRVETVGMGKVYRQSIPAGRKINRGEKITIYLK